MPGPGRPATDKTTAQFLNGCPVFLGRLASVAGEAVNNLTTATPFNQTALSTTNLANTLAGKMLLLQSTADGVILTRASNAVNVTLQTGAMPGVLLGTGERVILLMLPSHGWLQWMPSAGSANLLVWELQ
jgi:hypothetical protein